MKKLIYSRRGVAIELAIGVMFVMMALGIILVTNASLQNRQMNSDLADYEEKIEMYEITDWIMNNPGLNNYKASFPDCEMNWTGNDDTRTYIVTKGGEQILSFVAEKDGDKYKITSWN